VKRGPSEFFFLEERVEPRSCEKRVLDIDDFALSEIGNCSNELRRCSSGMTSRAYYEILPCTEVIFLYLVVFLFALKESYQSVELGCFVSWPLLYGRCTSLVSLCSRVYCTFSVFVSQRDYVSYLCFHRAHIIRDCVMGVDCRRRRTGRLLRRHTRVSRAEEGTVTTRVATWQKR